MVETHRRCSSPDSLSSLCCRRAHVQMTATTSSTRRFRYIEFVDYHTDPHSELRLSFSWSGNKWQTGEKWAWLLFARGLTCRCGARQVGWLRAATPESSWNNASRRRAKTGIRIPLTYVPIDSKQTVRLYLLHRLRRRTSRNVSSGIRWSQQSRRFILVVRRLFLTNVIYKRRRISQQCRSSPS